MQRFAVTFSVLARDGATGRMGVAVASCVLAIGSRACHAVPGVGLVSVQGGGWADDGCVASAALRDGASARQALERLSSMGRLDAQYAVLTGDDGPISWTGPRVAAWSGAVIRDDVCVHGNTLVGEVVVQAAYDAWAAGGGAPLEERLLPALQAGVAVGGDLRGQQSAALLSLGPASSEPVHDLRVDDARQPVAELQRLLHVLRAHEQLQLAWSLAAADLSGAVQAIRRAREFAPDDGLVAQCAAALLMQHSAPDEALEAWAVARRTLPDPALRLAGWADTLGWLDPGVTARLSR